MKQSRKFVAEIAPPEIAVELKADGKYTDILTVTLSAIEVAPEEGTPYFDVLQAFDPSPVVAEYGAIVEAIVALRYTPGEERALERIPVDDPARIEWLRFVEAAKAAARAALNIPEGE